jgi:AccI restriction endonuclease
MKARSVKFSKIAFDIKDHILSEYADLLEAENRKKYISILNSLTQETLNIFSFRVPGWSANQRLVELNECFRNLKDAIEELQKRTHLSITPKVEDIKVVYKWIETFNVPHFYFQVFFDKVYGISFENILNIISNSNNEDKIFEIEKDTKNQNKTTIKINPKSGLVIAKKVDEPNHSSKRKELNRGRLLFYVSFEGGTAYLDLDNLRTILKF